jgi:hypothetical protein
VALAPVRRAFSTTRLIRCITPRTTITTPTDLLRCSNDLDAVLRVLLRRKEEQHEARVHQVEADDQEVVDRVGHRLVAMEGLEEERAAAAEERASDPDRDGERNQQIDTVFEVGQRVVVHGHRLPGRRATSNPKTRPVHQCGGRSSAGGAWSPAPADWVTFASVRARRSESFETSRESSRMIRSCCSTWRCRKVRRSSRSRRRSSMGRTMPGGGGGASRCRVLMINTTARSRAPPFGG